jgi:hypothetical protein
VKLNKQHQIAERLILAFAQSCGEGPPVHSYRIGCSVQSEAPVSMSGPI